MFTVAPSATLDGLPDNVLLIILGYLSVLSLVHVSLVCRRFRHLSSDTAIWETVELTLQSLGRKLNSQTLKKIIRLHLAPCVRSVVLEETNVRGNAVITEALLDLLFSSCPKIETITLLHCDLRKVMLVSLCKVRPQSLLFPFTRHFLHFTYQYTVSLFLCSLVKPVNCCILWTSRGSPSVGVNWQ